MTVLKDITWEPYPNM